MKSEVKKIIEKELEKYKQKNIKISDKQYTLYVVPELCDEDLNIFEGFLFAEADNRSEVSYLKTRYKSPVSGYAPRIGIILYDGHLLIKDYRNNKHIIKTLKKINKTFLNKLKKALGDPKKGNLSKLFDRSDVIGEFYILFKKAREYLIKNIKGIPEEEKREEFVDNFMMQMLTLWYLQERGFFNNDKNYFITKFKEFEQKKLFGGLKNYYKFLTFLFEKISNNLDKQYYEDKIVGKVVVIGPAVFLNGEHSKAVSIPDKCFYKEGMTEVLINTPPKKVSQGVPLLNLFESRDWTEGNIDEFVLGAIYEKLITYMERKKLGAYYTPEEITSYICKNTIEPYLVDRVNEKFNKNFETIDQIIEGNDKEILLHLFEQLREIKILDPAVGSAHFLESAINVLVDIYEKIWKKAKELRIKKGFEIIATDEKGEIKSINLLEVEDEDKFKLLVKFFIILSKNIYGVDINPSALKIAKARLFLTLAKHFKAGKGKDIFIRFPNVHFNLREGNSLIGYVEFEKETKPPSLFDLDEKIDYITERIKIVSKLKPYLEKTAKSLNLDGDIVKEVKELNKILAKRKISWKDFKKVLRTKEKLITILIASLNSQYAKPLNELLREITDLFNQKLDEKFAEEHDIELEDLKKIKTFHWIFEFPEVFLDRGGFDVVVGNPPYIRIEEIPEKERNFYINLFETAFGRFDIYMLFVERGFYLSKNGAYFSMILPFMFLIRDVGKKLRYFVKEHFRIVQILDCTMLNVFRGVTNYTIIYSFIREEKAINYNFKVAKFKKDDIALIQNIPTSKEDTIMENVEAFYNSSDILNEDRWIFLPKIKKDIFFYLRKNKDFYLKEIAEVHRGLTTGQNEVYIVSKDFAEDKQIEKHFIHPIITGENISKWVINWDKKVIIYPYRNQNGKASPLELDKHPSIKQYLISYKQELLNRYCVKKGKVSKWFELHDATNFVRYQSPKIITKGIALHNEFCLDTNTNFFILDTCFLIKIKNPSIISYFSLICILNSRLIEFYFREISSQKRGGYREYRSQYLKNIPLIESDQSLEMFYKLLHFTAIKRPKCISIFDQLNDSLVYELYFKEKFVEDGLYPEPKEYLLEAVSKHLKPINYDRWAELYWKKQIEGNLTEEEQKELEKLEKENMKTVEGVYKSLIKKKEVQKQIEKIKSHKWVKVIEGEK